jgi:hypothetical protein
MDDEYIEFTKSMETIGTIPGHNGAIPRLALVGYAGQGSPTGD